MNINTVTLAPLHDSQRGNSIQRANSAASSRLSRRRRRAKQRLQQFNTAITDSAAEELNEKVVKTPV